MRLEEVSSSLIEEIKKSIAGKEYGSVEIYIESGQVVQITERTIKKTNQRPSSGVRAYNSNLKR
jgi:hypothetical protein